LWKANCLAMNDIPKQKALFLDRDGTINVEKDYVYKVEDFKFQPGIIDLMKHYADKGFLIFIITNQSGIARGFYGEKDFWKLTHWMQEQLINEGIRIEKVLYCPHHPDFTGECKCRKPKPGLFVEAIKEFNINPESSVNIGDKERDILAGHNAGIGKNLYIQDLLPFGIF
jgi:D-glycero-D-manno-heptose 1,7-bisphosphate phosphatase